METTKSTKRKGGCLFWLLVIGLTISFFTNPEEVVYKEFLWTSKLPDTYEVNGTYYFKGHFAEQESVTSDNYLFFTMFYSDKPLYKSRYEQNMNRPTYYVQETAIGAWEFIWVLDSEVVSAQ